MPIHHHTYANKSIDDRSLLTDVSIMGKHKASIIVVEHQYIYHIGPYVHHICNRLLLVFVKRVEKMKQKTKAQYRENKNINAQSLGQMMH